MDLTRKTYESIAKQYVQRNPKAGPLLEGAINEFCLNMEAGSLVLDIGTGPARDLKLVRERGFRVFGLDYSFNMLKESGVDGLVQGDAKHLPFADNTFDGVMSHAMIHHVLISDLFQVMFEFHRVLKPGGAIHVLTREGSDHLWDMTYGKPRLFNYMNTEQARRLFYMFEILSVRTLGLVPSGPGHQTDWISILARKHGYRSNQMGDTIPRL